MNILGMLLDSQGSPALKQLAAGFGLSEGDTRNVLGELVPALSRGMQGNLAKPNGMQDLLGALTRGNHQQYIDRPQSLAGSQASEEGNAILAHLLGSKDASRQVARDAAGKTGIDEGMLKKMLPVIATMVMGSMSKQAAAQNLLGSDAGASGAGMLAQLLDADKDGSVVDDVLGMARKLL